CNQSFFNSHRHPDVSMFVVADNLVLIGGINLRMLHQRRASHLDDDVVDADLEFGIEFVDPFAHFRGAIHFNLSSQEEMRYRSQRRDQAFGDSTTHFAGWLVTVSW